MLTHLVQVPRAPVSFFVENLWLVRGRVPTPSRQMLLPDGAFVVMFNLGDPQKLCAREDVRRTTDFHASWISGQQTKPLVIEQSGSYHLIGIRFRPGGAYPLFGASLAKFTGHVIELEHLWGRDARRLREQLHEQPDDRSLLRHLESWLQSRLDERNDTRIATAARLLREGRAVGAIAAALNCSRKHLTQQFTRQVGLTPKVYGRVQRLQRVIAWIGQRPSVTWSDAALSNGFYDQAHLVNEFQDLAGLSPNDYLARRTPYLGYLNVA
ncbi:MAG: DUF6597 domain-containing transcriptional factor [Opitutus sp.]